MFNTYSEKQLKQIAKLKGLLKEKVYPQFEIKASLKEIGELGVILNGEGLFELFEFVCLHPPTFETKDHISAFYELWLSKIAPQ